MERLAAIGVTGIVGVLFCLPGVCGESASRPGHDPDPRDTGERPKSGHEGKAPPAATQPVLVEIKPPTREHMRLEARTRGEVVNVAGNLGVGGGVSDLIQKQFESIVCPTAIEAVCWLARTCSHSFWSVVNFGKDASNSRISMPRKEAESGWLAHRGSREIWRCREIGRSCFRVHVTHCVVLSKVKIQIRERS